MSEDCVRTEEIQTVSQLSQAEPAAVLEHVGCDVCGSANSTVIYDARAKHDASDLISKFRASGDEPLIDRLVRCARCEMQYINPRLRADLILTGYSEGADPAYVSQMPARIRTFARALASIERQLGKKGRLLDVGTAAGAMLVAARDAGWEAEGCEPNRWLGEWGARQYGVKIKPGTVFEQHYEPGTFDVITLWDVVEHAPSPRDLIQHCSALLKPGGLLIVNYPDIGSWIARLMRRQWLFLTSVHLHYFNRRTMKKLLSDHGFEVTKVKPHFQWLELDYILLRGAAVSQSFSNASRRAARLAGLSRLHVPYWLGQTFVAARRLAIQVAALDGMCELLTTATIL
jgi:2-polyprenyl-3-methyl-5-hydroxy-6-metoxy-1,4-benzoquinol methylase